MYTRTCGLEIRGNARARSVDLVVSGEGYEYRVCDELSQGGGWLQTGPGEYQHLRKEGRGRTQARRPSPGEEASRSSKIKFQERVPLGEVR